MMAGDPKTAEEQLESFAPLVSRTDARAFFSQAISAKRQADALERIADALDERGAGASLFLALLERAASKADS